MIPWNGSMRVITYQESRLGGLGIEKQTYVIAAVPEPPSLSYFLQQYSFIPVCDKIQLEDNIPFENHITFQHFFSIWIDSYGSPSLYSSQSSQSSVRSPKAIYAKLSGLSKKAIDCAIKTEMQDELSNLFKVFIYDIQSRLEGNSIDINNPVVIKHKGRPPKRLVANVEKDVLHRKKKVLKDSSAVNVTEGQSKSNLESSTIITKGRKCGKFPKWIPDFTSGDVVRFTGKFSLNEEPPHDDIFGDAGDHLNLTKDNLPISSISVFLIGYVIRQVQDNDDLFKSIKLNVNEIVGKGNVADKFNIKCRYLKADEGIDNKAKKSEKIQM
ncbi:hypothetical protein RhiirC2_855528 [Rhizophagus irregularis]|uniref:Uncharacterized protein n=1 Tax=Rhizophagus irregularis TaxID=588596 RepID=A0A2N1MLZ8_9GLOM|nr:hypothetical protein RhiirC2_855528 [Rhizophagus irregularis]